jgi:hypothetical protein
MNGQTGNLASPAAGEFRLRAVCTDTRGSKGAVSVEPELVANAGAGGRALDRVLEDLAEIDRQLDGERAAIQAEREAAAGSE